MIVSFHVLCFIDIQEIQEIREIQEIETVAEREKLKKNATEIEGIGNVKEIGIGVEVKGTGIEKGTETGIGIATGKETESDTKIGTDLRETEDTDSYL